MRLRLAGVRAGYPGRAVLTGVDLELARPRTALLGANGSGKTTLLRVLSGAHEPSAGEVLADDRPLRHDRRGLRAHRQRVQLVLQDPDDQLFSADVLRDVSFGPTNLGLPEVEVRARVAEALDLLRIGHLADRPTHELSYGERKRVAIAGAVAMRPAVLLLDEPTSGLDPQGVSELLDTLAGLVAAGTALVLATHDVDLALAWADAVAVVGDGVVVTGDPVDVLSDLPLLERARLHRPWPLELHARLAMRGLVPPGLRPRTLGDVIGILDEGDEPSSA